MRNDERRGFEIKDFRIEERADGPPKIVGHAVVYNSMSAVLGDFREKFEPGAFKESLLGGDQRALWNHDDSFVLGRRSAGTLVLADGESGLAFEATPPETTWARDLLVSMRRGDIREMSFRFRTLEDRWETKDGENLRTVIRADLIEVSPVTFPAYAQTDVAVRSLQEWRTRREEEWKRENEHLRRLTEIAAAS